MSRKSCLCSRRARGSVHSDGRHENTHRMKSFYVVWPDHTEIMYIVWGDRRRLLLAHIVRTILRPSLWLMFATRVCRNLLKLQIHGGNGAAARPRSGSSERTTRPDAMKQSHLQRNANTQMMMALECALLHCSVVLAVRTPVVSKMGIYSRLHPRFLLWLEHDQRQRSWHSRKLSWPRRSGRPHYNRAV